MMTASLKAIRLQDLFNKLVYACFLLMPVYRNASSWFMIGLGLLFLYSGNIRRFNVQAWMIPPFLLYAMAILGLSYTSDQAAGWFDLQVKFPLIFFPLVWAGFSISKEFFRKAILFLSNGCIISWAICLVLAFREYRAEQLLEPSLRLGSALFFSDKFSVLMHHSYISMYMVMAIAGILYLWIQKEIEFWLAIPMVLTLSLGVAMLGSKMGFITLGSVLFISAWYGGYQTRQMKWTVVGLLACAGLCLGLLKTFPALKEKLVASVEILKSFSQLPENTSGGNAGRIFAYKSSIGLIKENWLLGTGTGSVRKSLAEKYRENGFTEPLSKTLNAHNQFFEFFIAHGVFGFFAFVSLLGMLVWKGWKNKAYFPLIAVFIFVMNFYVESILERQMGIAFFVMLYCILMNNESKNDSQATHEF